MIPISRSVALKMHKDNPHLVKMKLDNGKLELENRAIIASTDYKCNQAVKAIWLENRRDNYGPYIMLMCLCELNVV